MELIHPVTGVRRRWPDSDQGLASARPSMVNVAAAAPARQFAAITGSRLQHHAPGLLFTTVTPERALSILRGAINGDLQCQWELFCAMEEWDRLSKNLNEVKNSIKRLNWTVQPYAIRGEEPTASAQKKADLVEEAMSNWQPTPGTLETNFEDFIYDSFDAMGKGLAVQEIEWHRREAGILPRCARLLTPRQYSWNDEGTRIGLIARGLEPLGNRGAWEPFPKNQFVVSTWKARSGPPAVTALLRPLVPYWIGMTYGWRWLMQTAQLFGVPFRWATYDPTEPALKDDVGAMLEAMGSSGWAVFPQGTTLEFKEAVTSASDNPQSVIISLAKKACDLMILGQELSSESEAAGLGSGTAALQGSVRQEVLHHAAWWFADLASYQFILPLLELNYGEVSEPPTLVPDFAIDPDPKALADRDQVLAGLGMELPKRWMHERHNVPEPEAGEPVLEKPALSQPDFGSENPEQVQAAVNVRRSMNAKLEPIEAMRVGEATERLIDRALEELTGVQARWLGGVKPFFRKLLAAARDERVSDAEFVQALRKAQEELPELFGKMRHEELAEALEAAMGAACANGALRSHMDRGARAARADKEELRRGGKRSTESTEVRAGLAEEGK